MAIAKVTIDGATAIACLDPDDVRIIQAALMDSSRYIQQRMELCSANACCSGHVVLGAYMAKALQDNEELHARIAQITGIE